MSDVQVELSRHRKRFYRDSFRRMLLFVLFEIIVIVGMIFVILYMFWTRPDPTYFATSVDGSVFPLKPLSQPLIGEAPLLQWATDAAIGAYNFNFANWEQKLRNLAPYFTKEGYQNFIENLHKSQTLKEVLDRKFVVTGEPTAAPVINRQGYFEGTYNWEVELPLTITYQSSKQKTKQKVKLIMRIVRVPVKESSRGIGISSFIIRAAE